MGIIKMKLKDLIGYQIIDIATTSVLGVEKLVIEKGKDRVLLHTNNKGKLVIENFRET
jgi:hypothetical protein